jgi:hypothetical protein
MADKERPLPLESSAANSAKVWRHAIWGWMAGACAMLVRQALSVYIAALQVRAKLLSSHSSLLPCKCMLFFVPSAT